MSALEESLHLASDEAAGHSALYATISKAIGDGGLEAHLALLILRSGYAGGAAAPVGTPWDGAVVELLQDDGRGSAALWRSIDVAIGGVRLALGCATPLKDDFRSAAARELAREPMPPAACVRDDERLLLGVAAGIGLAAPELCSDVNSILRQRELHVPVHQLAIDLWAEALARGAPKFTLDLAARALRHLSLPSGARPPADDTDRIAAFWLASRLLDAPWTPTSEDLGRVDEILADGRRAARTLLARKVDLAPLDAALLLDALSASPHGRLERRGALEGLLALIDAFPGSARVLAKRKRGRTPLLIADEYDVQDLFHALALPFTPDLVDEDPAGKIAGKSVRLDFTSRAYRLGVELKHVRTADHGERVRKEVLLDERTYQEHPYIDTVLVFIHDPERHIPEHCRPAFEADLSQRVSVGGRAVEYMTRIR